MTDVQRDIAAAPNGLPNSGNSKLLPGKLKRWPLSECGLSADHAAMPRNAFAMTEALKNVASRCREDANRIFLQIANCSLATAKISKACTELKEWIAVPHRDISSMERESRFERLYSSRVFCRIEDDGFDSTTANYSYMSATVPKSIFYEVAIPLKLSHWAQCAQ